MDKTLKVVLLNKTTLPNGVTGPEYTPMTIAVLEMIQSIKSITPTPKFAYAANLTKVITLDELEKMIVPFETADHAAAIKETEENKEDIPPVEPVLTEGATEEDIPPVEPVVPAIEESTLVEGTTENTDTELPVEGEVIPPVEGTAPVIINKKKGKY